MGLFLFIKDTLLNHFAGQIEFIIIVIIIGLFIYGLYRIGSIWLYLNKENKILSFIKTLTVKNLGELQTSINDTFYKNAASAENSIIMRRVNNINQLISSSHGTIDHDALAETTFARESIKLEFTKSFGNSCIMLGLLATIAGLGLSFYFMEEQTVSGLKDIIHTILVTFFATIIGLFCAIILNHVGLYLKEKLMQFLADLEEYNTVKLLPLCRAEAPETEVNTLNSLANTLKETAGEFDKATSSFKQWTGDLHKFSTSFNEGVLNFRKGIENISEKEQSLVEKYEKLTELYTSASKLFKDNYESLERSHEKLSSLITATKEDTSYVYEKLDQFSDKITEGITSMSKAFVEQKEELLAGLNELTSESGSKNQEFLELANTAFKEQKEIFLVEIKQLNTEIISNSQKTLMSAKKAFEEQNNILLESMKQIHTESIAKAEEFSSQLKEAFLEKTDEIVANYKQAHKQILEDYKQRRDQVEVHYREELRQNMQLLWNDVEDKMDKLIQANNKLHSERSEDMRTLIIDFKKSMEGTLTNWKYTLSEEITNTVNTLNVDSLLETLENISLSQEEQIKAVKTLPSGDIVKEQLVEIKKSVLDTDKHIIDLLESFKEIETKFNKITNISLN